MSDYDDLPRWAQRSARAQLQQRAPVLEKGPGHEAEIQRAMAHLAAIVASSDDAIISKDLDGRIQTWNSGAQHIFGYSAEEAIGQLITLIIPADRLDEEKRIMDTLKRGDRVDHFETIRLAKDGRRIDVSLTVSPVRDAAGVVIGASKIARDITERKQAEQLLLERENALLEAARRKDEFLALLGHELRNPLAPIRNASELLARILADNSRADAPIAIIKRQIAQLAKLVDDLLDLGRITHGRIQLQIEPIDLARVVAQAIETVEPQFRQKHHRVSITSSYEALYVEGDFARLVQCVTNVLCNSAKYTEVNGEIRLQTRREGSYVVVEVTDTGVGIAPELIPDIFDLFVQGGRTLDRAEGGLGIGLSLVKRLIEMHGGEVSAISPGIGLGSTFQLRLTGIPSPKPSEGHHAVLKQPQSLRILVVDDNEDSANSLALLLTWAGHATKVAYSAPQALACIEGFGPDVAIFDIGLPKIDGYELARRIRAIPALKGIRLAALTGYCQPEDRRRSLAAGFDDHLVKPVEPVALERFLSAASQPAGALSQHR